MFVNILFVFTVLVGDEKIHIQTVLHDVLDDYGM